MANPEYFKNDIAPRHFDIRLTTPDLDELIRRRDNLKGYFPEARKALDQEIKFQSSL